MEIQKEMSNEIRGAWGNIKPYHRYATLNDVEHGYNFGCFFSIGDSEEQKKIILGIANLSLNTYKVVTLTSIGNVQLVENMIKVIKKLFPHLTFEGYREMIFDMLDESIVPVLEKYEKGFPADYHLLDVGNLNINDTLGFTSLSYSLTVEGIPFNYKMVPVIEDMLVNDLES
ncbi:hypothetical protein GCM10007216_18480 [Thalassobacillus devorans]|uniref:Uncharacterized protein n=1 Tax=Thalassobacillus devorans TaxID=279813 RepID=A0ABQ1NZD1_9BACI|nr:hypothetical protein [Thalassobacillus devorans]NIK28209.1 hypothetical protein [Thalassobacillus devorans]GGC88048.1 hypothetical protein GCM10007216_18480 [Thalassobacillus devorans]